MKKALIAIAIVIIIIFALGIIKDQIIKSVVTVVATQVTGLPVHIDGLSLGVLRQSMRISGFKMYNPKGFSQGIMIGLSRINVSFDLGALIKKKIHLVSAEIELREMGLEKNKEGKLNVDELKIAKQGGKQEEKKAEKAPEQLPLQIDMLKLGIGRIVFKDYSAVKEPSIKVYDINIHKSYKNITSVQQLVGLILTEPMKAAGIQGAKIYGVAMVAGVAVLPVAIAATFVGKDSAQQDFAAAFDNVYEVGLGVLKQMGKVTSIDKPGGVIGANINSVSVTLKIKKKADNKTQVIISARKYFLPRSEIAGGVLYEITQKLK